MVFITLSSIGGVSAFFISGRLKMIRPMPSFFSTMTSCMSPP
ncbi:MAG TPA: hypothetical protein PKC22_15655 [Rhodocyclaceae bacterium]|nr:hypothetical protein [Rhodocyclaceae bacterium]